MIFLRQCEAKIESKLSEEKTYSACNHHAIFQCEADQQLLDEPRTSDAGVRRKEAVARRSLAAQRGDRGRGARTGLVFEWLHRIWALGDVEFSSARCERGRSVRRFSVGARPLGGGDRRALLGGLRSAREPFAEASPASFSSRCRSLVGACDGRVRGAAPRRRFLAGMVFEARDLGMMGVAREFRGALRGGPAGSGLERAQT